MEYDGDSRLGQGTTWLQKQFDGNPEIAFLETPVDRGRITIADVHDAASPEEHAIRVHRWALSVWEAWNNHHQWARQQLSEIIHKRS